MKKIMTILLAAMLLVTACGTKTEQTTSESTAESTSEKSAETTSEQSGESNTLVISTWGTDEENLRKDVIEPFEKEFGVKVVLDLGNTAERLTKLKEDPNYTADIIELNQTSALEAHDLGLLENINWSKIEEFSNLIRPAIELVQVGYGVPYVINSIGIIYNPNGALSEINEWSDLWNAALEGRVAIPDITTTFGPALIAVLGDVSGTSIAEDNGAAAFAKLAELKPNIVKAYSKSGDMLNMFANGEIDAAIIGDFNVGRVKEVLPEAVYVVPQSGTYANMNTIEIKKKSKNQDLAYKYINFRLSKETMERTAKSMNETPTNKAVVLNEELAKNKTYGSVAQRAKSLDYTLIGNNIQSWIDQFNKLLNE